MNVDTINKFINNYKSYKNFTYCKINHGFWEKYTLFDEKIKSKKITREEADRNLGLKGFFTSHYPDELIELLNNTDITSDISFNIGIEKSAWDNDSRILGTPHVKQSKKIINFYKKFFKKNLADGILLKRACQDLTIFKILDIMAKDNKLIIGPKNIKDCVKLSQLSNSVFFEIPRENSYSNRERIVKRIFKELDPKKEQTVLLQAGSLSVYIILKLRKILPNTKWIDFGQALSLNSPKEYMKTNWFKTYKNDFQKLYNYINKDCKNSSVKEFFPMKIDVKAEKFSTNSCQSKKIKFIEHKYLNRKKFNEFISISEKQNHWANRGPLWYKLKEKYDEHLNLKKYNLTALPCSSGAVALEILISIQEYIKNKTLRWAFSSFSFLNLDRGRTFKNVCLDADKNGVLSLRELSKAYLNPFKKFDGVILTNPFGLLNDFSTIQEWCKKHEKILIVDNAAGISPDIPKVPYQALSLHHTKPYGFGEGGLAIIPKMYEELALSFIEYSVINNSMQKKYWITNGKLSDISCASLLCRLSEFDDWYHLYLMQEQRIINLALQCGYQQLLPGNNNIPKTSIPMMHENLIRTDSIQNNLMQFGKYYKPLKKTKNTMTIFNKILNIPCHPDVAKLSNSQLEKLLMNFTKL